MAFTAARRGAADRFYTRTTPRSLPHPRPTRLTAARRGAADRFYTRTTPRSLPHARPTRLTAARRGAAVRFYTHTTPRSLPHPRPTRFTAARRSAADLFYTNGCLQGDSPFQLGLKAVLCQRLRRRIYLPGAALLGVEAIQGVPLAA
ncbi:hypothetical protein J6590_029303 [Homalodisca vitripennis]|nr:hypothetical protein J6590_029303 [Homalodisca vitripennis]